MSTALRPAQARVLAYTGGPLAISAVPGAGKTYVLTRLVATLVAEQGVRPSQILVLTAMRSAARHFRHVVSGVLAAQGASAHGLTATTMHAFCLGLLSRHRPDHEVHTLSEAERSALLHEALDHYLDDADRRAQYERVNPPGASRWDDPRSHSVAAAMQVVAASRQYRLDTETVARALSGLPYPELVYMLGYYEDALATMGALDFDAQIRQALGLLEGDAALLARLRDRYRYVLEDEAQDSTPAQNRLLELLTGVGGNLVRVGDPNQAITGTFTFTDPRYFRAFCHQAAERGAHVAMAESSRSGRPILALANALVALAQDHPEAAIRQAFEPVAIAEAASGPANPPPHACSVQAFATPTVQHERLAVIQQVRAHLRAHPQDRVAILVATNAQVRAYQGWLAEADVALHAPEQEAASGKRALDWLQATLELLGAPGAITGSRLAASLQAWWRLGVHVPSARGELLAWLEADADPRALLFSTALPPARPAGVPEADYASAVGYLRRLGQAFTTRHGPGEACLVALADAFVPDGSGQEVLMQLARRLATAPDAGLTSLKEAAAAWRRGLGHRMPAPRGESAARPGTVQVLTLHRSKGLEFEAVWLPGLGPSRVGRGEPQFPFPWRPEEVNLFGHKALLAQAALRPAAGAIDPEAALALARREAVCERLRLLYVGITRARRHLTLSCHTHDGKVPPPAHLQRLFAHCHAGATPP